MKKFLFIIFVVLILILFIVIFGKKYIYHLHIKNDSYIKVFDSQIPFTLTVSEGYAFDYGKSPDPAIGVTQKNQDDIEVFSFSIIMKNLMDKYIDTDGFHPQNISTKEKRIHQYATTEKDSLIGLRFLDKVVFRNSMSTDLTRTGYMYYEKIDGNRQEYPEFIDFYDWPIYNDKYWFLIECHYTPPLTDRRDG